LLGPGARLASAFTGRANLYAEGAGLALVDTAVIDAINLIDEAITVATVPAFEEVEPGQMLATVKIIPFSVSRAVLDRCLAEVRGRRIGVALYRPARVGLISTALPDTKPSVLAKTESVMADRLAAIGAEMADISRVGHDEAELAEALKGQLARGLDPLLVVGASAIVDRGDIIPAAIERAGGKVEHFGMPVDPGNLLLLGRIGEVRVLGVPGCARSPKLNGFDFVLRRMIAGVADPRLDLMKMGAGGLLKEITSRPMPRAGDATPQAPRRPRIAAVVLAAGRSTRMGPANKLLQEVDGRPMVARVVDAALASTARPVVVVTGHQADEVRTALAGRDVSFVHNPDYATGLASSLRQGIGALPADCDGALVSLGDMPRLGPEHFERLIAAFSPVEGRAIVVPTWAGKRGNPVLWAARFFPEMKAVAGDVGARHLIGEHAEVVREVESADDAVLLDVDTPDVLARVRGQ
jgi:molybdenum cofactor cytidylyltransferase